MLDKTPSNLLAEAVASITVRDAQLRELKTMRSVFTGPYSHAKGGEHWPDNFVFQYISFALPKTAYNNPRFKVKSSQSAPKRIIEMCRQKIVMLKQQAISGMVDPMALLPQIRLMENNLEQLARTGMVSEAMQWGMNQWVNTTGLEEDVLHFVLNCLSMYGVMKTVQETKPNGTRIPRWQNVSPNRFGFDPLCLMFGGARYCFQQVIEDKEDVIRRAKQYPSLGWDIDAIESVAEDTGAEEVRAQEPQQQSGVPRRKEIAYFEFWVREDLPTSFGPDEGFHGTIYTVAKDTGGGAFIRKEFAYYGPDWGPYCLGGVYPVIDSPFPLSPVMANYAQARDHNDQVRAGMAGAKSYKRIVFVPAGAPDVKKQVADAPHDFIIPIKGLKKDEVIAIEIGGISDQQLKQIAFSREILRRSAGLTENAVAQQEGGAKQSTATEAAIIDEASDTRMAFVQQRINTAICQSGKSAAWFLWHDKKSVVHLGDEAGDTLNMAQPTFFGGHEPEKGDDFYSLGIEIDVMSMPWSGQNQEKQNAIALLDQIVKVAPLVQTVPAIDWKDSLNRVGDAFNESDLGDIIDEQAIQEQMQMAQQQMANESAGVKQDRGMAVEQHKTKMTTEHLKQHAIHSGANDKRMVAQATVKERGLKGRSYGAKASKARVKVTRRK